MASVAMDLRIGILGPLDVRVGFGEPVQVVGPRLRALLIRLATEPDRVVLAGQLIDAVWDSDPPAAATGALQSLVSRLRRLLPDVLESHAAGYRLSVDPEAVDSVRFERLALAGRDELRGDPRRARELLGEALALWRGPALADVATARFAGAAVARLEELRLGAIEDRIEAELASAGTGSCRALARRASSGRGRRWPCPDRCHRRHAPRDTPPPRSPCSAPARTSTARSSTSTRPSAPWRRCLRTIRACCTQAPRCCRSSRRSCGTTR